MLNSSKLWFEELYSFIFLIESLFTPCLIFNTFSQWRHVLFLIFCVSIQIFGRICTCVRSWDKNPIALYFFLLYLGNVLLRHSIDFGLKLRLRLRLCSRINHNLQQATGLVSICGRVVLICSRSEKHFQEVGKLFVL